MRNAVARADLAGDHAGMSADIPPVAGGRAFEIRLLGPVTALRLGRQVALGGPSKRAMLALLVLEAGQVIPAERLIEELWRSSPAPECGDDAAALSDLAE